MSTNNVTRRTVGETSLPDGTFMAAYVCLLFAGLIAAIRYGTLQSWIQTMTKTFKSRLLRYFPSVAFAIVKAFPTGRSSGQFSESQFLLDVKQASAAIGAPYSENITNKVLKAYGHLLQNSVVLWRATETVGAGLNYRFSQKYPVDALTPAIEGGLLEATHPSVKLVKSWTALYPGKTLQLCDFDSAAGLVKHWILIVEQGPVDEVLDAEGVPEAVRSHRSTFHKLGLESIRFTAVDYGKGSMNLYFVLTGSFNAARLTELVALTGSKKPISSSRMGEMLRFLSPEEFHFAVTLTPQGVIERVAFYAMKMPVGEMPQLSSKQERYLATAPSYDAERMQIVAWSFDRKGDCSMKVEQSYCGGLYELLSAWGGKFSDHL